VPDDPKGDPPETRGARGGCATWAVAVVVLSACTSGTATGHGDVVTDARIRPHGGSVRDETRRAVVRTFDRHLADRRAAPATWIAAYRRGGATADQV